LLDTRALVSTGLEYWADVVGVGTLDDDAIARVKASPGFAPAMRHSMQRALGLYHENPVFHRNMKDIGRFVLGVVALYMDATGGVTHRRLRDLSGGAGITSAGRATAILWQLRRIGYVLAVTDKNGKTERYVPTEEMRSAFRERFRLEFQAAAMIDPAMNAVLERFDEPAMNRALMKELGEKAIEAVSQPFHEEFSISRYSQRTAGMLVLFALLKTRDSGEGAFPQIGPVNFSIAQLSKQFEVSRSHVRRLLKELEKSGYFQQDISDGGGELKPLLKDEYEKYYCYNYIGLLNCAHHALAALSRSEPRHAADRDAAVARAS
jgi:hypothetical protein